MGSALRTACVIAVVFAPVFVRAEFDTNLGFGMRGEAVEFLQQFLIAQNTLSADNATGYFGPLTHAAVQAFQRTHGIEPVTGYFGPLTRAKATEIAQSMSAVGGGSTDPRGDDVAALVARIAYLQARLDELSGSTKERVAAAAAADSGTHQFSAMPRAGPTALSVEFSALYDEGESPELYRVDFGDGVSAVMQTSACVLGGRRPCKEGDRRMAAGHTYSLPGTYVARLRGPGAGGDRLVATTTIVVHAPESFGALVATPRYGRWPLSVTFSWPTDAIDARESCRMVYGDGKESFAMPGYCPTSKVNTYQNPGVYEARLYSGTRIVGSMAIIVY